MYQKMCQNIRKRVENYPPKAPKSQKKLCQNMYQKNSKKKWKKTSRVRRPWEVLTRQETVLELLNKPTHRQTDNHQNLARRNARSRFESAAPLVGDHGVSNQNPELKSHAKFSCQILQILRFLRCSNPPVFPPAPPRIPPGRPQNASLRPFWPPKSLIFVIFGRFFADQKFIKNRCPQKPPKVSKIDPLSSKILNLGSLLEQFCNNLLVLFRFFSTKLKIMKTCKNQRFVDDFAAPRPPFSIELGSKFHGFSGTLSWTSFFRFFCRFGAEMMDFGTPLGPSWA